MKEKAPVTSCFGERETMKTDEIVLLAKTDGSPVFRMYHSGAQPGHRPYREHHHTECEISAILSGACQWQIRHQPVLCGPGDVLIFGSDEEHYITDIADGEKLQILNLQFEPRFIWSPGSDMFDARYLSIFLKHQADFQNRLDARSAIAQKSVELMQQLRQECHSRQPEYELIVKATLMQLLGYLGRHHTALLEQPAPGPTAHLRELEEALNYMDAHLTEDLTLEQIARAAGLSRSYFSAVFRQLNGVTVWDYITRKRIELAMDYLRQGKLPITQIALLCGFNTMANFNRSFKMVAHCTPSQFRRQLESEDATANQ